MFILGMKPSISIVADQHIAISFIPFQTCLMRLFRMFHLFRELFRSRRVAIAFAGRLVAYTTYSFWPEGIDREQFFIYPFLQWKHIRWA